MFSDPVKLSFVSVSLQFLDLQRFNLNVHQHITISSAGKCVIIFSV